MICCSCDARGSAICDPEIQMFLQTTYVETLVSCVTNSMLQILTRAELFRVRSLAKRIMYAVRVFRRPTTLIGGLRHRTHPLHLCAKILQTAGMLQLILRCSTLVSLTVFAQQCSL